MLDLRPMRCPCGAQLPPRSGPGRPRRYCSDECRDRAWSSAKLARRHGEGCADCGAPRERGRQFCAACRRDRQNARRRAGRGGDAGRSRQRRLFNADAPDMQRQAVAEARRG